MDEYIPYLQQWLKETPKQRLDRLIPDQMSWDITNPQYAYTPEGTSLLSDYLAEKYPTPLQGEATPTPGPIEEAVYWTPVGMMAKPALKGGRMAEQMLRSQVGSVKVPPSMGAKLEAFLKDALGEEKFNQRMAERLGLPGGKKFSPYMPKEKGIFRETAKPTGPSRREMAQSIPSELGKMWETQYEGLPAKAMLGDDLIKEITDKGYTPEIRSKILDRYKISQQREKLIEQVKPHIEKIREAAGKGSRGYMYGSAVSGKPNITDVDLMVRAAHPETDPTAELERLANAAVKDKLHSMLVGNLGTWTSPSTGKRVNSWAQILRNGLRARYPGAEPVRLWGTAPIAYGLQDYLGEE